MRVIGVKRSVPFYSLDVIISVGYRVKSQRGTQFRIWANRVLKQYLVKGYAINEKLRKEQIGELRKLVRMLGRTIQKLLSFGSRIEVLKPESLRKEMKKEAEQMARKYKED